MTDIRATIKALEEERAGYERADRADRVADVDAALEYWRGQLDDAPDVPARETLSPSARKQLEAAGGDALAADEREQYETRIAELEARIAELADKLAAAPRSGELQDEKPQRPELTASTDEWRTFAKHPAAALDVPDDAGHDAIVAAYIAKNAPTEEADVDAWGAYAKEHDVDPDGKDVEQLRSELVEAGWARAAEPAPVPPKRTTQDKKPRQTR